MDRKSKDDNRNNTPAIKALNAILEMELEGVARYTH